jgi:Protein of unknown function (DUF2721)
MPDFDLKDLLQAVGPTASLIFAAWIFLTFLQSRYTSAYEYFRALIAEFRTHREQDQRRASLRHQILIYKRRCEYMRLATNIGVTSAILLITALICAALGTMYDTVSAWKYLTAACAIIGLLLVIWAATLVILENYALQRLLESDLSDLPELVDSVREGRTGGGLGSKMAQKA